MKRTRLRLSNFQSFAEGPTEITFAPITFLIGPNGSGKTALLQALARMFSFDHALRRIQRSDFHVKPASSKEMEDEEASELWIEADFEFAELLDKDTKKKHPTIPSNFAHMCLESDG